ncbi:universal stress protein [Jatrophihabitans lederbergiae]|uniref:Universal stress protein n=1 Tax=Jatrophihabitans lederbergiae TaxID=3075547 RepID=A0ABU2JHL0_9ACTN|nr:universal stress protein [Jatrophihabitans sp. DSM 44399]MDT0264397.1 universal stress protein [Jatrophihabitans sp. DSM 44399]
MSTPETDVSTNAGSTQARVVVGVDGSPSSIAALRWAACLAPSMNAQIQAITTWQYPTGAGAGIGMGGGVGMEMADAPEAVATTILDQALSAAFAHTPPAGLHRATLQGNPAQVLLDVSTDFDALMLIVGSRGHGGFVGLLIGSTSAYCAEHATCPVLVVHAAPDEGEK